MSGEEEKPQEQQHKLDRIGPVHLIKFSRSASGYIAEVMHWGDHLEQVCYHARSLEEMADLIQSVIALNGLYK